MDFIESFFGLKCAFLLHKVLTLFRANTDILLGKNCGLQTLMVGTGVHKLSDIRRWETSEDSEERRMAADFFVDALGDLSALMDKSND
jgi:ribonucleotide monophosphatase NagD (HAD superfamily)